MTSAGIHHQRHRDDDALTHAARQLMRILVRALRRRRDADDLEHLDGALPRLLLRAAVVNPHDLGDLIADREHRIQRRHRLLKDHRDARAANPAHRLFVERDEILAVELDDAAGLDVGRAAGRAASTTAP